MKNPVSRHTKTYTTLDAASMEINRLRHLTDQQSLQINKLMELAEIARDLDRVRQGQINQNKQDIQYAMYRTWVLLGLICVSTLANFLLLG